MKKEIFIVSLGLLMLSVSSGRAEDRDEPITPERIQAPLEIPNKSLEQNERASSPAPTSSPAEPTAPSGDLTHELGSLLGQGGEFSQPRDFRLTPEIMDRLIVEIRKGLISKVSLAGHVEVGAEWLARLKSLPGLRALDLKEMGLHDNDTAWLTRLTGLEELDLSDNRITGDTLTQLSALSRLRVLNLSKTNIDDKSLEALKNLKNMEEINLSGTAIDGSGLVYLKGMNRLRVIDLGETRLVGLSLTPLRSMVNLEVLHVNDTHLNDQALQSVKWLPRLKFLNISCTDVSDKGADFFREHKDLQILQVCTDRH